MHTWNEPPSAACRYGVEAAGRGTSAVVEGMKFDSNYKGQTDAAHAAKLRFDKGKMGGRLHSIRGSVGPKRSGPITPIASEVRRCLQAF